MTKKPLTGAMSLANSFYLFCFLDGMCGILNAENGNH